VKMKRREFVQVLAASGVLAPLMTAQTGQKLRYCPVGLGRISLNHFMPGTKLSSFAQITAVATGHREKGLKAAAEYNFPEKSIYSYETFDEISNNKDIDAVYIGLPNSMHAEYTIRAAKAGKHVLCEKPMATSVKDCEAMIQACKDANVKLFIAYRCQYEPVNLRVIELIRNGSLGKIEAIESANGFDIKSGEWRLDQKLAGGGPLMDVGIYSLNACRYLTGEEPVTLDGYAGVADHDGRFDGVEENLSWSLKFPSGAVASCSTTYGANQPGFYRVHGSKGMIHAEPAFAYQGIKMKAEIKGQAPIEMEEREKDPSQFAVEADAFAECIWQNNTPKTGGEEGLRDMRYIQTIYRSAGLKLE
jgi:predicted dehydrogenase